MFVIEKTSADVTFMLKVNITDAVAGSRFTGSWSQPDLSPSSGQAIVSFGLGRFGARSPAFRFSLAFIS
eukprot:tig00000803_g4321.t1